MHTHTATAPREELVLNYLGCTVTINGRECFLVGVDSGRACFEHEGGHVHLRFDDALKRLSQNNQ